MRGLLVLATSATLLAGCGSDSNSTAPEGLPLQTVCGDPPKGLNAKPIWLHTSDGVRLYAATAGDGSKVVVLLHKSSPANLCNWLGTMKLLADRGIRSVAVDFRGNGRSDQPPPSTSLRFRPDVEAAIQEARDEGSDKVFLLGASLGGAAAMTYAPNLKDLAGVVSLSGELKLPEYHLDPIDSLPSLRVPFLAVGSREDEYFNASDARRLIRAVGSADKRIVMFAGAYHGWDLLDTAPSSARVRSLVLEWPIGTKPRTRCLTRGEARTELPPQSR